MRAFTFSNLNISKVLIAIKFYLKHHCGGENVVRLSMGVILILSYIHVHVYDLCCQISLLVYIFQTSGERLQDH